MTARTEGKMRTGFVWHERYMWQEAGDRLVGFGREVERFLEPGQGYLGPEPKRRIRNLLEVSGVLEQLVPLAPRAATVAEVARVHGEDYIRRVEDASRAGGGVAGPAASLGPDSFEIALLSAGGVIAAVDAVLDGHVDNAYALVRPPGHHATRDQGLALCIFGNVAIAARHLREARGLERVAIVDWDAHHGNGTQASFYDDPTVLTISLHQEHTRMDASTGTPDERGVGDAVGCNLNIPLPAGSGLGAYMAAMERVILPALRRFRPEFVLIASGLDANIQDPTARMMLRPDGFRALTEVLLDAAGELCQGRLVAAHEGGYSKAMVPFCGLAVIASLAGVQDEVRGIVEGMSLAGEADQALKPHQAAAVERALGGVR